MPDWIYNSSFDAAIARSLFILFSTVLLSMVIGLPAGILAGLYHFKGRRLLLGLFALPLIMPSFLWAIGLSQIQDILNFSANLKITKALGPIYTFSTLMIPLTIYTALLAVKTLSKNQLEAFRMVNTDFWSFKQIAKRVIPITLLITLIAGVITLSDPGPGQIFGFSAAASEVLISFSALYDFDLARGQSIKLATTAIILCLPFVFFLSPYLSTALQSRESNNQGLYQNNTVKVFAPLLLVLILVFILFIPLAGLTTPLIRGFDFDYAMEALVRSGGNTLFYAFGAGFFSTITAVILILLFAQHTKAKLLIVIFSLSLIAVPSSFFAISTLHLGSALPASWDWLFRTRLIVALVLAIHFLPIALLLILKRYASISHSWLEAAKCSGVPNLTLMRRVIVPYLMPAMLLSFLVISLLSSADIGTVLLLRPPGEDSFPLTIFTVMANASETVVSTLCLVYVVISAMLLAALWGFIGRQPT